MFSEKERKDAADKLDEISFHTERLNDWERNFVEKNTLQLEEYGTLSEKQLERLEQIYEKITK